MSGFRTAFASNLYICLAALAYRALITAGFCCRRLQNGYRWLFGALLGGVIGLIWSAFSCLLLAVSLFRPWRCECIWWNSMHSVI